MADDKALVKYAPATMLNGIRVGMPSPMAIAAAERIRTGIQVFNDGEGISDWVWAFSPGDSNVPEKNQNSLKVAAPSHTSATTCPSTVFDKEQREIVQYRPRFAPGSTRDLQLITPITQLTSSPNSCSLQNAALQRTTDASLPVQTNFFGSSQFLDNQAILQKISRRRLSSPLPITQVEVERALLDDSIKMYPTPMRGNSAVDLELAAAGARAPSREPYHSRSGSRTYRDEASDARSYYSRSRGNSTSSGTYQQLGNIGTPEQGRLLQNRYEFQSSDADDLLSPVPEIAGGKFPSHVTTMSDLMNMRDEELLRGSRDMSRHKFPPKPAEPAPATKKEKHRPPPLDLTKARQYAAVNGRHTNIQIIHNPVPASDVSATCEDDSPSVYGDEPSFHFCEEPSGDPYKTGLGRASILKGYSNWMEKQPTENLAQEDQRATSPISDIPAAQSTPQNRPPQKNGLGLSKSFTTNEVTGDFGAPPFTPLTPWLANGNPKKAKKNLFGDKGWLEDTAAQKKPERLKNTNSRFFDGVKKTARKIAGMADFKVGASRVSTARELNITLDPREQSLLYCELEFILSNTLSGYINGQLHLGRLNPHIHAKIADSWAQMGRPKVIGFRYDLETQIDMIYAHIGNFRFHGPHYADCHIVKGLLYGTKMNARTMRIRTLCQPDSVIAKHILDSQALMQLLNSPPELQTALAEVCQFFRTIIEVRQEKQEKDEISKTFTEYAPNTGFKYRSQEDLSPPKGKFPGEYRVKNQIGVPPGQRNFSGPTLEPKVYKTSDQPHALTK
ncbi:uncharacterized protein F4812DRAFT_456085 [Daldinia caldariorum]|uniref:uncharacterized protein n=1 Tax=Daldinia caldariorum TaxID=326644 RepID=UPI002007C90A|nr:uncharacterized protein F4812DRAFT_456085 [Daldinia caldariorum]KAI1471985.1 hypothetical protein F4812DRAFT_456085 [Daldinia caldariorum]